MYLGAYTRQPCLSCLSPSSEVIALHLFDVTLPTATAPTNTILHELLDPWLQFGLMQLEVIYCTNS